MSEAKPDVTDELSETQKQIVDGLWKLGEVNPENRDEVIRLLQLVRIFCQQSREQINACMDRDTRVRNISILIKEVKKILRITQKELANKISMSLGNLRRIETEEIKTDLAIKNVLVKLGLTWEEFQSTKTEEISRLALKVAEKLKQN